MRSLSDVNAPDNGSPKGELFAALQSLHDPEDNIGTDAVTKAQLVGLAEGAGMSLTAAIKRKKKSDLMEHVSNWLVDHLADSESQAEQPPLPSPVEEPPVTLSLSEADLEKLRVPPPNGVLVEVDESVFDTGVDKDKHLVMPNVTGYYRIAKFGISLEEGNAIALPKAVAEFLAEKGKVSIL